MNNLLVVIPALNEEKSIGNLLSKIIPQFNTLVVSDGSVDKTVEISELYGAKVLSFKNHQGYDKVINKGFYYAAENGYKKVITFDADGQHEVKDLQKIARLMDDENIERSVTVTNTTYYTDAMLFDVQMYLKTNTQVSDEVNNEILPFTFLIYDNSEDDENDELEVTLKLIDLISEKEKFIKV